MPYISRYHYIETMRGRKAFLFLLNETAKEGWKPVWSSKIENPEEGFYSMYLYKKCRVDKLLPTNSI